MVGEIAANMVAPAQGNLKTCVLHVTCVDVGRLLVTEHFVHRGLYQPVLRFLHIPVEIQAEATADEACVDTDIGLLRGLPSHVLVGHVSCVGTSLIYVTVDSVQHVA